MNPKTYYNTVAVIVTVLIISFSVIISNYPEIPEHLVILMLVLQTASVGVLILISKTAALFNQPKEDPEEENDKFSTDLIPLTPEMFSTDLRMLISAFMGEINPTYNAGNLFIGEGVMRDLFGIGALIRMAHIDDERMYWAAKLYLKHKTPRHAHYEKCEEIRDHWEKSLSFCKRYEAILIPEYEKEQVPDKSNKINMDEFARLCSEYGGVIINKIKYPECIYTEGTLKCYSRPDDDPYKIDDDTIVRRNSDDRFTIYRAMDESYRADVQLINFPGK
jgi:hypothetical protein